MALMKHRTSILIKFAGRQARVPRSFMKTSHVHTMERSVCLL